MKNQLNHPTVKIRCKCGKEYATILEMLNCSCSVNDPPDAGEVADKIYYEAHIQSLKTKKDVHDK